ncbi:hypothetical protein REA38_11575 [Serratia sp. MF2]|uniref:hypothetical protein n=1 Tax=Serratia sp. MF1(2023) TaxID=3059171 RepID=UPI0027F805DB|nr:hypothetical protein [Serratia sp. MF1(2023)]MDQ7104189.1 hypothetical protein [Serratia sp. MF1(2023)]
MFNPYLNQLSTAPYLQQLEGLKQQLQGIQQPYQQPYQQPQYQQPQYQQPYQQQQQMPQAQQQTQIPNFQLLIQQEIQRQLGAYQQQQGYQGALPMLAPPAAPPVPPGAAILSAIGGVMTENDQRWLSANIGGLPAFFNTSDGKELVNLAISTYKKHCGINDD